MSIVGRFTAVWRGLTRNGTFLTACWLLSWVSCNLLAQESARLSERLVPNSQQKVTCQVRLSGSLQLPAEKEKSARTITIRGNSQLEYDERILTPLSDGTARTIRVYRSIDFRRSMGDQQQEGTIRQPVRRLVVLRNSHSEVPFSPDGAMTWGELDLIRTDVFTPTLLGVLPDRVVRVGERWTVSKSACEELTDMEKIEEGALTCQLEQLGPIAAFGQRRHAVFSIRGTIRGINEDGPNRQVIEGNAYFDIESQCLCYLSILGTHTLLDKDGKSVGEVRGEFTLTRRLTTGCSELSDASLQRLKLEPDAENTQLLYDNSELGVKFLYPRNWRVGVVRGRQFTLDGPAGCGALVTVEANALMPSDSQYLQEARTYLEKQKSVITRIEPTTVLQDSPRRIERFGLLATQTQGPAQLGYYLLRQRSGGLTVAARLPSAVADTARADLERILRSLEVTRTIESR